MRSDPRKSAGRKASETREEQRFNIVLRGVFVLLVVMMIVMTIIWQLASRGIDWAPQYGLVMIGDALAHL
ncbi:MAG: hypothetical protein ACRDMV_17535 [Streptosporangiales bacterium]